MGDRQRARQIVHLTHTDPRSDSRILKAMQAGREIANVEVIAIGKEDSSVSTLPQESGEFAFYIIPRRKKGQPINSSISRQGENGGRPTPSGVTPTRPRQDLLSRVRGWVLWAIGYLGAINLNSQVRAIETNQFSPGDIAIIHVHDFQMLFAGIRLKFSVGGKLIYDAHELESETNGISWFNSFVTVLGEKLLWKHIDGLVTVSPGIEAHYLTTYGPLPSAVILNSPRLDRPVDEEPDVSDVRTALGLTSPATLFVYVGYLQSGRGIEATLKAFEELPDPYHVVFLGKGPLAETIDRYAHRTGRIHRLDPVPHDRVVPFIATADFGLCLVEPVSRSDEMALPNKLFECLAAGLPILGSNLPEIARLVGENNCGITSELEPSELRKNAQYLAENTPLPDWNALEQYSWQKQAANLLSLYQRVSPELAPSGC